MNRTGISHFNVQLINRSAPRIEREIDDLRRHLEFLGSLAGKAELDGRTALEYSNRARRSAMQLRHSMSQLATAYATVSRRSMGDQYGQFSTNYKAVMRRIRKNYAALETALNELESKARSSLNEKGRWGDGAADTALTELFRMVTDLLKLWHDLRIRNKLEH